MALIWLMGNIGAILTCIVFYQPAFCKSPCAMYFLASSFAQFFTYNFALFIRMLQYGYNVNIANNLLWFCKLRYYLFYICTANSRYNIIMASIDRYFASSRNARRRQWSSSKVAYRIIISMVIFWCIIYIQVFIFYRIEDQVCRYQNGAYATYFSIYISIDSGLLPILLMLIFGLLTVRNIHETKRRVVPATERNNDRSCENNKLSRKDAQLYKMLANQIIIFVIFNFPNPCFLLYQSSTMYIVKSTLHATIEVFVSNMTYVLIYLGFSLTFINFALSSEIFRRELRRLVRTNILRR
ncbi:unnamed protein product [Adineta ricciae]|uniref:G-protein coupled receptors family 1 profile domain-containing protein n=1 Tax=Adineta ricciae TaxID=249248 RepID=A0A814ZP49_ADIRI|nr:unnamed protein product [Adineta ricciae]CAF1477329.1 unnamed protein product [Adineta ricciae]